MRKIPLIIICDFSVAVFKKRKYKYAISLSFKCLKFKGNHSLYKAFLKLPHILIPPGPSMQKSPLPFVAMTDSFMMFAMFIFLLAVGGERRSP